MIVDCDISKGSDFDVDIIEEHLKGFQKLRLSVKVSKGHQNEWSNTQYNPYRID